MSNKLARYQIALLLAVLLSGSCAYGQSPVLSLASGSAVRGGSLSLNLSLNAGANALAGLQWSIMDSPGAFTSLSAVGGPVLTTAGKTLNCVTSIGAITCLATGVNTTTIGSGVVAVISATLSPTGPDSLDSLPISNVIGVLANETSLSV